MRICGDGELLPEFWVGPREVEVDLPKERRMRQARKVTDIFTWLQRFGTCVAVLGRTQGGGGGATKGKADEASS